MIELAQHIEALLLENDCVIVPGLGGFVAHYTSAVKVAEENIFLPPARIIGFNPQLKMNDGLLVQSYMAVYDTNFSDATKIVDKEVNELLTVLHEDGKADLPNVGELHYSIHGIYDFMPYDNRITTPYLYGLDSFEMNELSASVQSAEEKVVPFVFVTEEKKKYKLEISRSYLTNAVAMIAVVVLFFFLSVPVENTEVAEENYAQLLPGELFEKIGRQSLAITPIVNSQTMEKTKVSVKSGLGQAKKKTVAPISVKEIKVGRPDTPTAMLGTKTEPVANTRPATSKFYHIIVASVGTAKDAEVMAKKLVEKGFADAKAIVGDGKMRVSIESCSTEVEAYRLLNKIRQNEAYHSAWVLKK